jgi:hypothetical protein
VSVLEFWTEANNSAHEEDKRTTIMLLGVILEDFARVNAVRILVS